MGEKARKTKKQTVNYREQIDGCQRWGGLGMGGMGEIGDGD